MNLRSALRALLPVALTLAFAFPAHANLARIEVKSRTDIASGKSWGAVGPYERIIGTAYFSVDPRNPHNAGIVNIDKAPRNAQGMVEFSSDIYIMAPKNPSKGNGVAFFEVPNRGGRALFGFFANAGMAGARITGAPDDEGEFGDGSLLTQGYTLVWVGWQFSLARGGPQIGIDLPVATNDGKPVAGRVTAPFTVNLPGPTLTLDPDTSRYPPVDPNSPDAVLTVIENVYDAPRTIPRADWQFAKLVGGQLVPDPASLFLRTGFVQGQTYQLSYTAKNTPVGGLGFTALRDVAAAFRQPGAMVTARYEYVFGQSQTGRFLREYLYEGFNADENGHKVFDAVWAHIAGTARANFTQPFSLPNGLDLFTGSPFPYSDAPERDPASGKTDGLLAHMAGDVVPKIFYTNGDCEFWGGGRSAALAYTALDGSGDLKVPDNVRIYHLASAQHVPSAFPPAPPVLTQQETNPNNYRWAMRALLTGLDAWVRQNAAPPASRYPSLADHTLVNEADLKFPAIPGVQNPRIIPGGYRSDLGGPQSASRLPFLIPNVDADGNDTGGIRLPELAVPLATYTGWNFRAAAIGAPTEIVPLSGGFIPFAVTRAARQQANDPRPSIAERYASRDAYLRQVRDAAQKLAQQRYVLRQDVDPIVQHAGLVWDTLTEGQTLKSQR